MAPTPVYDRPYASQLCFVCRIPYAAREKSGKAFTSLLSHRGACIALTAHRGEEVDRPSPLACLLSVMTWHVHSLGEWSIDLPELELPEPSRLNRMRSV